MASLEKKIDDLVRLFVSQQSKEAKYDLLISLGRKLPKLSPDKKTEANLVYGCQSQMYLYTSLEEGLFHIEAESDALISAGLAALLIKIFDGETPETVLKSSLDFFDKLGIKTTLSQSRSNGFYYMHLRIKQDALKFFKKSS